MLEYAAGLLVWRRQFTSLLRRVDALELGALQHLRDDGRCDGCTSVCGATGEHRRPGNQIVREVPVFKRRTF